MKDFSKFHIILASNSPRRRELLKGLDLDFDVQIFPNIDESYPQDLNTDEVALFIAKKKASTYRSLLNKDDILITADTIVVLGSQIFGKPRDAQHAKQMLTALSGKTHQVITGVCLTSTDKQIAFQSVSEVSFSTLEDSQIDYYIANYKPFDKAGSYGVQEWIGYIGVENIKGSYFNIMGLPVDRLYKELLQF